MEEYNITPEVATSILKTVILDKDIELRGEVMNSYTSTRRTFNNIRFLNNKDDWYDNNVLPVPTLNYLVSAHKITKIVAYRKRGMIKGIELYNNQNELVVRYSFLRVCGFKAAIV